MARKSKKKRAIARGWIMISCTGWPSYRYGLKGRRYTVATYKRDLANGMNDLRMAVRVRIVEA